MFIYDIYNLGESNPFEIKTHEEASVDLELVKTSPCCHTLLSGIVLSKCLPLKNASVMVLDNEFKPISSTLTDANGEYSFCNILEPGIYNIIASAIGYKTSNIKTILIYPDELTKLSFTLKKNLISVNGIVYGKILEAGNRKPIVDAEVYLKSLDDSCNTMYKTFSNNNGQYLIYNILPNEYSLIIKKQGYLKTEMSYLKIEKYDRVSLFFDLIRYSNNSNSICGMITSDNIPIPKADVFLYEINNQNEERIVQEQMTNNIGLFLFLNVESGLYLVKGKLQNSVVYEKLFSIK